MSVMLDQELLGQVQLGVMEANDSGATFPSGLWTAAEVLAFLNNRMQRFVKHTRVFVGRASLPIALDEARPSLSANDIFDWMQTLRVMFVDAAGRYHLVSLTDHFLADRLEPGGAEASAAVPVACSDVDVPTLTLQLMPAPNAAGTLWLHYIPRPPTCDRTGSDGNGSVVSVPRECTVGLKFGLWADMLGQPGRSFDPARAQYAEQRFSEVEEITRRLITGFEDVQ